MTQPATERILEAVLQAADKPLTLTQLRDLFDSEQQPSLDDLRRALDRLADEYQSRAIELREVASGWRLQVREEYSPWVSRLSEERPQRYSRAMLETLSLVAYRQPVTRGEIEDVRGVAVSSQIMRTLLEREWVRIVGHRDVPGRPAMYATTRQFLDYFNLRSLAELPPLAELRDITDDAVVPVEKSVPVEPSVDIPWTPVDPLSAPDPVGDFSVLLDELKSMETGLKTDFEDLPYPEASDNHNDPTE